MDALLPSGTKRTYGEAFNDPPRDAHEKPTDWHRISSIIGDALKARLSCLEYERSVIPSGSRRIIIYETTSKG